MDMWTVISAAESDSWRRQLDRLPRYDVYHEAGYHRAYEADGASRAYAYVAEVGGEILFHPIMLRPIETVCGQPAPSGLCDAETVYGYSGPLATSQDPVFLFEAWQGYRDWCREQGLVCEFQRFNPLLENHVLAAPGSAVWHDRSTVVINLSLGEDQLWSGYTGPQRNRVRKAQKSRLQCDERDFRNGLPEFMRLYELTMDNLNADDFYKFPRKYYERLLEALGANLKLFTVTLGDESIAAGLFMVHGDRIHYHLGCSSPEYRDLAPNNLLFHEVARWAIAQGLKTFHLGGGRTPSPDDTLLRFKKQLSPKQLNQFFGKHVHDRGAYEDLRAIWRTRHGSTAPKNYLQFYRLEPEAAREPGAGAAA